MTSPAPILAYPDPLFARRAEPRPVDAAMQDIGVALLATARHHKAYGLAAAHIGAIEPLVVVSVGPLDKRDYRLLFSPEIVAFSADIANGPEGSVSMPGIEVDIPRSISIDLVFDDAGGARQAMTLEGFPARVAQHEIDQMNGIFFLDRLSRLKRDAALRRFRKLSR